MSKILRFWPLMLLLALAAAVRWVLAWKAHVPTLDTAIVGQMAMDILNGDRLLFFAGQKYMGALEAYALAGVFAFLPPGRVTMCVVTIAFALLWTAATFFFFRKDFGDRAALAAALVPAFPGWSGVWYTTVPYGGYPETYAFGMLLMMLGRRVLQPQGVEPSWKHATVFSLLAGISVWTNLQILPYLAAAGVALALAFWRRKDQPWKIWLPYGLIPVAVMLAFLPQLFAEASHVQPPMFDGLSFKAIGRSWSALWTYDLRQCALWTFPPAFVHILFAALIAAVVVGALVLILRRRRQDAAGLPPALMLCGVMLLVFAVTYFPHPMSGRVPRYIIAPLALMMSAALAAWVACPNSMIRRVGGLAALLLAAYNIFGTLHVASARAADAHETLSDFQATIEAACQTGWDAILHTGSETEGYDGARLTFLSGGKPIFASAYSDRFLRHQTAWEFGGRRGFLSRHRALPYVMGSLDAMQAHASFVDTHAPYALIESPEVARVIENVRTPDRVEGWEKSPLEHPLFDASAQTAWLAKGDASPAVLRVFFNSPVRINGLRISAPSTQELPSRYTIRVRDEQGVWHTAQECERRIAGSYLSGTSVYFRGHHPWMDVRFPPVNAMALELAVLASKENPTPRRICDLRILETTGEPWPNLDSAMKEILRVIGEQHAARVVCERGLARLLHRYADAQNVTPEIRSRLPIPYNPRFFSTQPEQMPLTSGSYLLLVEEPYVDAAVTAIRGAHGTVQSIIRAPPYGVLLAELEGEGAGALEWRGFSVFQSKP